MHYNSCHHNRVPIAQRKQGKGKRRSLSGKVWGIWKFASKQGILFIQCYILKVRDIALFSMKLSCFCWEIWIALPE